MQRHIGMIILLVACCSTPALASWDQEAIFSALGCYVSEPGWIEPSGQWGTHMGQLALKCNPGDEYSLILYCPIDRHIDWDGHVEHPDRLHNILVNMASDGLLPQAQARACSRDTTWDAMNCTPWVGTPVSPGAPTYQSLRLDISSLLMTDWRSSLHLEVLIGCNGQSYPSYRPDALVDYRVYYSD